jgi:ribosomal protein L11 methyltransferase
VPLKRVVVRVPLDRAEDARAEWIERFPGGFEERELAGGLELAAYVERIPDWLEPAQVEDVEPGWEDGWRAFHRPVRIGPLWVGPPWERPPGDAIGVVIDPGRAFGTGAHATTRLCLELLLALEPGPLLDVGCGSGVLAIAAAKLGFAPVAALDVDPLAVEATRENAAVNGVEVEVILADAVAGPLPVAPCAVANIARAQVEALAPLLRSEVLVASGYLEADEPELPGWRLRERRALEGWAAALFARG